MKRSRTTRRRRRIAVVTGTRAEYGVLRSTLEAIRAHPRLELQLVATGMHLLRKFGRTIDEIRADGFDIAARVRMQSGSDAPDDQAVGLSRGVAGLARFFERSASDVVLVLGDRIEALAGALAAVTTGRVLAHVHGGDVASGDFDDSLRHAITKLAHVHFVATRQSLRRVVRLGEERRRVHLVGAPGLDRLRQLLAGRPERERGARTALVVQHAYGRAAHVEQRVMAGILRAVAGENLRRVIVYPNSDRGHAGVIRAIERHAGQYGNGAVGVVRSLPRDEFLRTLLEAEVLVGNSSSGIIEAPFAGTPSVNVGARQAGRQVGGRCVLHTGESLAAVRAGLRRARRRRPRRAAPGPYGDGGAGRRIAQILAGLPEAARLTRKLITY